VSPGARRGFRGRGKPAGSPPRVRGLGGGRKSRRSLERGGEGPAAGLNALVSDWPGVKITPMFGRWGYLVGDELFACFPLRRQDTDLWLRLSAVRQQRAIDSGVARPHRRFARRGWVEISVAGPGDVRRAAPWLREAYEFLRERAERGKRHGG